MDRQSTCTDLFYILVVTYCANNKGKKYIYILYIATSFKQQAQKIKLVLFAKPTLSGIYSFTTR